MKTKIVMNQDKNRVELDIIVVKWELGRGEIGGFLRNNYVLITLKLYI